ncbi:GIY-YIG nuclease family protein [Flavihumibacter sp. R14]|nr:GIY-YIG nuclease family protein [Flavihumibacter soli]
MSIKEELTRSQVAFLEKHKIAEDSLINANGGGMTEELRQRMIDEEKIVAYNSSECTVNSNHRFVTQDGHCPQCIKVSLQNALEEYEDGYVYIIGSVKAGLVKIGLTTEIVKRVKSLNGTASRFAGCDDWEMLFYAKTTKIGKTARLIREKLENYLDRRQYTKIDKPQKTAELFRCSYNKARQAYIEVHNEQMLEFTQKVEKFGIIDSYQFRNLIATTV